MKVWIFLSLLATVAFVSCSVSEAQNKLQGTRNISRTGYDQTVIFTGSNFDFRYKDANGNEQAAAGTFTVTRTVFVGGLATKTVELNVLSSSNQEETDANKGIVLGKKTVHMALSDNYTKMALTSKAEHDHAFIGPYIKK